MNTLVVKYLPGGTRSRTDRLLEAFLDRVGRQQCRILDLVAEPPDFFKPDNLAAYIERDYLGRSLTGPAARALAGMDRMVAQLQQAQTVVLATPMHNFSLPALVKGWFDAVLLKGHTWTLEEGGYRGLLTGRRALALCTSGGVYTGETAGYDLLRPQLRTLFGFMGFDPVETILAQGMGGGEEAVARSMDQALAELDRVVTAWYGPAGAS